MKIKIHNLKKGIIWPLYLLAILSGFNFIKYFKINEIPYFQSAIVFVILFYLITSKKYSSLYFDKIYRQYFYYIIFSVPAFLFGLLFFDTGLISFFYSLFPLLLIFVIHDKISNKKYLNFLKLINLSMFTITIVGWLIRLNYLPLNFLFDVIDSEFEIGYWGIRYESSTRNADYLYPLLGLSISMYFYLKEKKKLLMLLICFYLITIIASYSRGGIILSLFSLGVLFYYFEKKWLLILILSFAIIINYDLILFYFNDKYSQIIESIFHLKSIDSKFSNEDRINIIKTALESFFYYPFGTGIDNYALIYKNAEALNHAENIFLTALIERGWLAFCVFISFFYSLIKSTIHLNKITLNKILVFNMLIYFSFNYELNNAFANFVLFILMLDYFINSRQLIYG